MRNCNEFFRISRLQQRWYKFILIVLLCLVRFGSVRCAFFSTVSAQRLRFVFHWVLKIYCFTMWNKCFSFSTILLLNCNMAMCTACECVSYVCEFVCECKLNICNEWRNEKNNLNRYMWIKSNRKTSILYLCG